MSVTVSLAQKRDLPVVAHVIASAMVDDEVIAAIMPGERNRLARLTRLLLSELRVGPFAGGVIDVARRDSDGVILGAAAWERPGHKTSTLAELRELPQLAASIGVGNLRRALRLFHVFETHRPAQPHWYLTHVAVAPEAQGHGVGSTLMRHRLSEVDDAGAAAYLEATTPGSQQLYERFGFVAEASLRMTSTGHPISMTRPPAPRG